MTTVNPQALVSSVLLAVLAVAWLSVVVAAAALIGLLGMLVAVVLA